MGKKAHKSTFGNVRKLESGRFQARFTDDAGRVRKAPQTFETRTGADDWIADQRVKIRSGDLPDPSRGEILFQTYSDKWFRVKRFKVTSRTLAGYQSLHRRHLIDPFGNRRMAAISKLDIREWHAEMIAVHGPVTVRNATMLLSGIFREAVADELILRSPVMLPNASKEAAKPRPDFTVDDAHAVIERMPQYLRLPLNLALAAHLRLGELVALDASDFDVKGARLTIDKQLVEAPGGAIITRPKAGSERTVSIPSSVVNDVHEFVRAHPRIGSAPLFSGERGDRLSRGTLQREWVKARKVAGLVEMHIHDLRHVGLTLAAQGGTSLADLMHRAGHSTVRAALRYQHAASERDVEIAIRLDMLLKFKRIAD